MLLQIASSSVPLGVGSDSIESEEAGKTKIVVENVRKEGQPKQDGQRISIY